MQTLMKLPKARNTRNGTPGKRLLVTILRAQLEDSRIPSSPPTMKSTPMSGGTDRWYHQK